MFQGIAMNYLDKTQYHLFLNLLRNIRNKENTVAIVGIIVSVMSDLGKGISPRMCEGRNRER